MTLDPRREFKVTASMAPIICAGKPGEVFELWEEALGQKPPRDFSNDIAVQLGKLIGPFMVDWLERSRQTEMSERERYVQHPTIPWLCCTLDAYCEAERSVYETKFLNPFRDPDEFTKYYGPQLAVQMASRECDRGVLAVLRGTGPIVCYEMQANARYATQVIERLNQFRLCVETWTPPEPLDPVIPPERWRAIDLNQLSRSDTPNWAGAMQSALELWSETKEAADKHAHAKDDVKALLPDDVGAVTYNNLIVKRSRNSAVTIREQT